MCIVKNKTVWVGFWDACVVNFSVFSENLGDSTVQIDTVYADLQSIDQDLKTPAPIFPTMQLDSVSPDQTLPVNLHIFKPHAHSC